MIPTSLIIAYTISSVLNYLLLRRNYIRTGAMPLFVIVMSIIPFLNMLTSVVMLWVEIEETVTYDRFLQFIFFVKNKE